MAASTATPPPAIPLRYLIVLLLAWLLPLAAVATTNLAVDPLLYRWPRPVDRPTAAFLAYDRETHLNLVAHARPRALLIGNSQTQLGFVPSHWQAPRPAINAGVVGSDLGEMRRMLATAEAGGRLATILLGIDFTNSRVRVGPPSVLNQNYVLAPDGRLRATQLGSLLSYPMLKASYRVVNDDSHGRHYFGADGEATDLVYAQSVAGHGGPLGAIAGRFAQYHQNLAAAPRDYAADIRAIRDLACAHGSRLTIFLTPLHALWIDALPAAGRFEDWQNWKRSLVRLSVERRDCGFDLWDFNTYNPLTTAPLPSAADRTGLSASWDGVHFRSWVGDRILARIAGHSDASFGVRLTSETIELALARDRAAALRYHRDNPGRPRPADILRLAKPAA